MVQDRSESTASSEVSTPNPQSISFAGKVVAIISAVVAMILVRTCVFGTVVFTLMW